MAEEKTGMLSRLMEIPKDMVLNLPRVSLFGNLQCCVENHQGILQYTPEQIGLQTGKYRIYIDGQELVITSLSAETIYIEGKIGQVRYEI
ncbi:MAG: sporulation protein YqfC [Peptococcaceae bacterium]|nr:sporulation protein YqfC [Peptococcaceae bacterium]